MINYEFTSIVQRMKRTFSIVCLLGLISAAAWSQLAKRILPPPGATPSVNNGPRVVERPRFMIPGPSGELVLSDSAAPGAV